LIELLVVVSVIALLVATLLPTLQKVREQGRRAVCGVHQRQVVLAMESYALYAGELPVMNRQGSDINYRRVAPGVYERQEIHGFGPETWDAYLDNGMFWWGAPFRGIIFQIDIHPAMGPNDFGKWRNFGMLWTDRAFPDPRGLFCPSQRNRFYAWQTPYNPWPPTYETARRPDYPNYANHTESSFERRMGLTGVPWDRIDPHTVLVTDRLLDDDDSTRIVRQTHRDGCNLAYRDGHVRYVRDDRFHTWMPQAASGTDWKRSFLALYDWLDHQYNR
jgi:hypothetical protein